MALEIYGNVYDVAVGGIVYPDGWRYGCELLAPHYDAAQFGIQSPNTDRMCAVNVRITGRTIQRVHGGFLAIRVAIEFVNDGEPNTTHGGWISADGAKA